jgi:hypothetical protein
VLKGLLALVFLAAAAAKLSNQPMMVAEFTRSVSDKASAM